MKNNSKLEILKRKHIGKSKLEQYKLMFENLNPYCLLNLEESDLITEKLSNIIYPYSSNELINRKNIQSFVDSDILKKVYDELLFMSQCYIYTDDYLYCGMCLTNARKAITECFQIAERDYGNTCFLLDNDFLFYIVVNYYDNMHNDYPNCFEIRVSFYS